MSVDWKILRKEHVERACEKLSAGGALPRAKQKGLVVRWGAEELPAKRVLQLAYCVAKGWSLGSEVKFASGDGTIKLLRSLGFVAERKVQPTETAPRPQESPR